MIPFKHFIASHSHRPPQAAHKSKVVLKSERPDAEEVSQALDELKKGKKLFVRENSRGERILTTKAPRWYRFNAKQEQKSVVELLRPVLLKSTLDPQVNHTAMDALNALYKDARNTPSLRSAVKQMADCAAGMRYTPKAESRHAVKHPQPDVAAEGPAPTESALPNTVEADLQASTDAPVQAEVYVNIAVEQPDPEPQPPAKQDLRGMKAIQRGLAISQMTDAEKAANGIDSFRDKECQRLAAEVNRTWSDVKGDEGRVAAYQAGEIMKSNLGGEVALMTTGILGYLNPEAHTAFLTGLVGDLRTEQIVANTQ